MTAGRTCRRCSATLSPDITWCPRCFEPVRHLTPRDPQIPPLDQPERPPRRVVPSALGEVHDKATYSRWRGGSTTFGPFGRIMVTLLVAAFFPWGGLTGFGSAIGPLMLWYLLGYTLFATMVLRSVWRKERVEGGAEDRTPRPLERVRQGIARWAPAMARPIRLRAPILLALLGLAGMVALGLAWVHSDLTGRYYLAAIGTVALLGMGIAWWNGL